jgi:hypothetical protein
MAACLLSGACARRAADSMGGGMGGRRHVSDNDQMGIITESTELRQRLRLGGANTASSGGS